MHLGLLHQDLKQVRAGGLRGPQGLRGTGHPLQSGQGEGQQPQAGGPPAEDSGRNDQWIEDLVEQRRVAKKVRDFPRADALRKELAQAGIVLEDSAQGTRWRRA